MATDLAIAILAGAVALVSALVSVRGSLRTVHAAAEIERIRHEERYKRDIQAETSKYREPLANAAFDLQSRIYNICHQNFFGVYFSRGDQRSKAYAVDNTLFLFCQYFCWSEIVRRDIQLIDLGDDSKTRALRDRQLRIQRLFATDALNTAMRVFSGEQRAIGERLISNGKGSDCIGYGEFLKTVTDTELPIISDLHKEVKRCASDPSDATGRLVNLHSALIDLIDLLDPEYVRFPLSERTKMASAST